MRRVLAATIVTLSVATLLSHHVGAQQTADPADPLMRQGAPDAKADLEAGAIQPPATQPGAGQRVVTEADEIASAQLPTAKGGPATGQRADELEPVALFYGPLPTGVTMSREGRLIVTFPRWTQPTNYTLAEVKQGQLVPFPDAEANLFRPQQPDEYDPAAHLVSVQSAVFDGEDRLWILDTGSINFAPHIEGAAKVWAYDIESGEVVKKIDVAPAMKPNTYLNDVRLDLTRADEGVGYITDSGAGGIIVFDIASGEAWRKLDGHESVMADESVTLNVEGQPLLQRPPNSNEVKPMRIHADGIALSPDGQTLYWTPLTGRKVYSISTDLLVDRDASEDQVAQGVRTIIENKLSANDGIFADAQGRIFTTDFEDNAIRVLTPPAHWEGDDAGAAQVAAGRDNDDGDDAAGGAQREVLFQDERLLWPDTLWLHDGHLFITANQLNRQPQFHRGQSQLAPPFVLFRYPVDAEPIDRGP